MRLRKICSLFIVIMLLMMTCSCEKGENNMKAETSASDEYSARDCAARPLKLSIHSGGIEHACRRR